MLMRVFCVDWMWCGKATFGHASPIMKRSLVSPALGAFMLGQVREKR